MILVHLCPPHMSVVQYCSGLSFLKRGPHAFVPSWPPSLASLTAHSFMWQLSFYPYLLPHPQLRALPKPPSGFALPHLCPLHSSAQNDALLAPSITSFFPFVGCLGLFPGNNDYNSWIREARDVFLAESGPIKPVPPFSLLLAQMAHHHLLSPEWASQKKDWWQPEQADIIAIGHPCNNWLSRVPLWGWCLSIGTVILFAWQDPVAACSISMCWNPLWWGW